MNIYFTGTASRRGLDISKYLEVKYLTSQSIDTKFSNFILIKMYSLIRNIIYDNIILNKYKPNTIIYEHAGDFNPMLSILIYRFFNKCNLFVDCHTCVYVDNNFNFIREFFNRLIIKKSKIFIAHNSETLDLKDIHNNMFVLESKVPDLYDSKYSKKYNKSKFNIVFITRFNDDEPIKEMILATNFFKENFHFYFTGNYKKKHNLYLNNSNVTFTGFLENQEYNNLLKTCDVHVVLTDRDYTLLYGGRESIALGIPLIVSNNKPCSNYFHKGSILTNNKPINIANSIKKAIKNKKILQREMEELKNEKDIDWDKKLKTLKNKL